MTTWWLDLIRLMLVGLPAWRKTEIQNLSQILYSLQDVFEEINWWWCRHTTVLLSHNSSTVSDGVSPSLKGGGAEPARPPSKSTAAVSFSEMRDCMYIYHSCTKLAEICGSIKTNWFFKLAQNQELVMSVATCPLTHSLEHSCYRLKTTTRPSPEIFALAHWRRHWPAIRLCWWICSTDHSFWRSLRPSACEA